MRVLVTGGAGFIGSNYVRNVLTGRCAGFSPHDLTVLDRFTWAGNRANLAQVADDERLSVVEGDICDRLLVRQVMAGTDLVVHFAAESHVDRSTAGASEFVMTNVVGTHTLLQGALNAGVPRFVHISRDQVYGSIDEGSWTEDHPLEPSSPYAASKASSDMLALAFHVTHGLNVSITRCSNNYGPYQHPRKAIPLLVTNLIDGHQVPLYGDGLNVQEWLHVDDHCRGIQLVAERGRAGEVYNIGGGAELTNHELLRRLLEITGHDASAIRHVTDRKGHDRRYALDSSKITAELGYRPTIGIEHGLRQTVVWYTQRRDWWQPLKS